MFCSGLTSLIGQVGGQAALAGAFLRFKVGKVPEGPAVRKQKQSQHHYLPMRPRPCELFKLMLL